MCMRVVRRPAANYLEGTTVARQVQVDVDVTLCGVGQHAHCVSTPYIAASTTPAKPRADMHRHRIVERYGE